LVLGLCGCWGPVSLGRGVWEEAPAFLSRRLLLNALEEDATRRPAPGPSFGPHTAVGLTLERVHEDSRRPVWPQYSEHLCE
jgi:hypothetical protein